MTEPNEPATPLSRMRFSWQRGPTSPERPDRAGTAAPAGRNGTARTVEDERPGAAAEPQSAATAAPASPAPLAPAEPAEAAEPAEVAPPRLRGRPDGPPSPRPEEPEPTRPRPHQLAPERSVGDRSTTVAPDGRARPDQPGGPARPGRRAARGAFDVPPPGGRFSGSRVSGGRGTHVAVRFLVLLTTCLLALAIVGYVAFSFGVATMRDKTYTLSPRDVSRFGLTEFPVQQAGRFAADYVRLCLTHLGTPGAVADRQDQLARYVSAGTDPACGWNGRGNQSVISSVWTGDSEPLTVPGYRGHARWFTIRALTSSGSRLVTVPVYVADLAHAEGMRIVGDLGEVPQPNLAPAPEATPDQAPDTALATALVQGKFFDQYFTAWGASNRAALERFTVPDATPAATAGLAGSLGRPSVQQAQVFLPAGVDSTDGFSWEVGMRTQAWVWVTWHHTGAGGGATETRAYRLQLEKTTEASNPSQEWAVRDIRGGVPDVGAGVQ